MILSLLFATLMSVSTPAQTSQPTQPVKEGLTLDSRQFKDGFTSFRGKPAGDILATGSGRVSIIAPDGKIKWTHRTGNNADAWLLPNGNVLFADGNCWEITPNHKDAWVYKSANQQGGGAFSCQRLTNGNTLIGENSTGKILEVSPKGKTVWSIDVGINKKNRHQTMRFVRQLDNGNILVCHSGQNRVVEYDRKGKAIWEQKVKNLAFAAVRMADGSTYISSLDRIERYSADHKILWTFHKKDIPGLHIRNMTGFQILPTGNIMIGCYAAYHQNKGVGLFEITPKKEIVWVYRSPKKRDGSMMGIQLSTTKSLPNPLR